ncbi:hypothetical protein [Olivibacter domesticus]|uniref:Uncharacterized protein n=1 Tax=Olivibacter domesticus TaxID=407022 RepID=A0A1H7GMA4_OLID1|nr:hypothetical protein [Olivibacter domesticus]SEK39231.1 hypothetical protein SAMN05661044_00131 [Olivibacter domesticus]
MQSNPSRDLPNNLGGAIALGFGDEQSAYWGTIANDCITALVAGGIYDSAEAAVLALKNSNYLGAVKNGYEAYNGTDDAIKYFTEYKSTHQ